MLSEILSLNWGCVKRLLIDFHFADEVNSSHIHSSDTLNRHGYGGLL
jgi:hypothetical protein